MLEKAKQNQTVLNQPLSEEAGEHLQRAIVRGDHRIQIHGLVRFTQSDLQPVEAELVRDRSTEKRTFDWIHERSDLGLVLERFGQWDSRLKVRRWPNHRPYQVARAEGVIGNNENVFMIFPYAFHRDSTEFEQVFGLELVEFSERIFSQSVSPCLEHCFSDVSELHTALGDSGCSIRELTFAYAVVHEMAHWVGPFQIGDESEAKRKLSHHEMEILTEFSADMIGLDAFREFPEVALLIFLTRVFWYGRRDDDGTDIDAVGGRIIWNRARQMGVLKESVSDPGRFELDWKRLPEVYSVAAQDWMKIGREALASSDAQAKIQPILDRESVLDPQLKSILSACREFPTQVQA